MKAGIERLQQNWVLVIAAAALVVSLSMGIRQTFGLFQLPIIGDLGISRSDFAFAIALQQILWGLAQPGAGILADKYGTSRILAAGAVLYTLGLICMASADNTFLLNMGGGVLIGIGLSSTSFAVVLGAVGRMVSEDKRSMAFGLASAGGSFGQFIMMPFGQGLIDSLGWSDTFLIMAAMAIFMALFGMVLMGKSATTEMPEHDTPQSIGDAIREASLHRGYIFLTLGFFVCGFQVSFIYVHLPAYMGDLGLPPTTAATALALVGFFNILGTFACGALGGKYSKKYLLSSLYFLRAAVIIVFLYAPKTEENIMIFAALLGLLWLGTVPLTSGLVAQIFGPRYMATLFGIVFFSHQVGSFIGVYLGGYLYDTTGSYDLAWKVSIGLGLAAALIHIPIADKPVRSPA